MLYTKQKAFPASWTRSRVSHGFTLVELIVVITILAILGTIAFISFQGFSQDARDSKRLNDIRIIERGFSVLKSRGDTLPLPDDAITITASGTIISYQGNVGAGVLRSISQAGEILDPSLNEPYTYAITADKRNAQLMGYFEKSNLVSFNDNKTSPFISQTHAVSHADLFPRTFGDSVGILTTTPGNVPIQNQTFPGDTFAFSSISSSNYVAYLKTGISEVPERIIPNGSCNRILELGNSIGDGIYVINPTGTSAFDVYCDMTIAGGGWTLAVATYSSGSNGVGNLAGSNSYGDVSNATTGITGSPGGKYKLADINILAIQNFSTIDDSADYLFNQIGYSAFYSGGNNEYITFENYTAEWNYGARMSDSSTDFIFTSYRRFDGAVALRGLVPANSYCVFGGFGINCSLAGLFGEGGGLNCDIDLRTLPANNPTWSGAFFVYMGDTNSDSFTYACNGAQNSYPNIFKSRYFIRERN